MNALLQLKGIDKAFPGVKALSGAALNVYPGRVMALVGENGAGKSTMMKVLTGIYTRDAGSLLWLSSLIALAKLTGRRCTPKPICCLPN